MRGFRYSDPCCNPCDPPQDPCCLPPVPTVQVTNGTPVNVPEVGDYPVAFDATSQWLFVYLDGTGWTPYPARDDDV